MLYEDMPPLKVFRKGTNVRDVDIVDRGTKMIFTCFVHPGTATYASKNPSHSRWFLVDNKTECTCAVTDNSWALAAEYKPKRND